MQLTIRGLPPAVEEAVRKEATNGRISLNKAVIRLLEKAMGLSGADESREIYNDLDRFCGIWSAEEATDIEEILVHARTVDEELWR